MALPLLAVRRMRSETGGVILPGCPIPGSQDWSAEIKTRRIKQGFAVAQKAPAKSAKPETKKSKAKKGK